MKFRKMLLKMEKRSSRRECEQNERKETFIKDSEIFHNLLSQSSSTLNLEQAVSISHQFCAKPEQCVCMWTMYEVERKCVCAVAMERH